MNLKTAIYICVQLAIINVCYSQSLNRILPNCGLNVLPIAETLFPNLGNQLNYLPYDLPYDVLPNTYPGAIQPNTFPLSNLMQTLPNLVQPVPNLIQPMPNVIPSMPNVIQPMPNLMQPGIVSPTIIQEDTVANNLANALQLLVVSNLLRNKLPQATEYVSAPCGSFNYMY